MANGEFQRRSLTVGLIASALAVFGASADPAQFFRSYLMAFLFWAGIALGSMGILMIHHLTGGAWGTLIRPQLEAATRTMGWVGALFLPLLLGLPSLYIWSDVDAVKADLALQHKAPYLNIPFFSIRALIYLACWMGMAWYLRKFSRSGDESRLRKLSAGGLVLLPFTVSFAAMDWVMSLEPHWYSTTYGLVILTGQGLAAMAFMILQISPATAPRKALIDLGNLLLTMIMLWAYISFLQFLIIWSGNIPEEVSWFTRRTRGGWGWVVVALSIFQFAAPFSLLLFRGAKGKSTRLALIAIMVLLIRIIETYWLVVPAFHPEYPVVRWQDLALLFGIGGLWLRAFGRKVGVYA